MSTKSKVVPLGILLFNENKGKDMIQILSCLHKYVPTVEESNEEIYVPSRRESASMPREILHKILFGGDQLTVARMRGAQAAKTNSITPTGRMEGFEPVIEDWHTKVVLIEVIWKYFYKTSSASEHGTLYQIRNLINRSNVGKHPKGNFDACDDFLDTVLTAYILYAAMSILGMSSLDDQPSEDIITSPQTMWTETAENRKETLSMVTKKIINDYINLSYNGQVKTSSDEIYNYSSNLLKICLLYAQFKDAVQEGDGKRILQCWRYLLPIFHNSGRKNYCLEAFNLLCQFHYDLPPQQAAQLIWSRTINTHGIRGRNIPFDLHWEHLNRLCKDSINNLGANKTSKAVVRCSKALGTLHSTLTQFDNDNNVVSFSGAHKKSSFLKDVQAIISDLQKCDILSVIPGRNHPSFSKPINVLNMKAPKDCSTWIKEHLHKR